MQLAQLKEDARKLLLTLRQDHSDTLAKMPANESAGRDTAFKRQLALKKAAEGLEAVLLELSECPEDDAVAGGF